MFCPCSPHPFLTSHEETYLIAYAAHSLRTQRTSSLRARSPARQLTHTSHPLSNSYVIAHAAHYLVESMGLEMASVPKLAAKSRAGEGEKCWR